MSQLKALYTLEVKDKKGKTVSKITKPCNSFVIQFLQQLEAQMYPSASVDTHRVGEEAYPTNDNAAAFHSEAGVGAVTHGIVVGTGITPVDNEDMHLETLIAHGVGAGQLSYGASSKVTSGVVGANVDFQAIRTFSNTSGGTINVTEIGLYSMFSSAVYGCMLHEVVTAVPVANAQTLTVTITFRTTA